MGTERFCGFRELQCEKWGFGEGFGSGLWTSEMEAGGDGNLDMKHINFFDSICFRIKI